ncbi:MAG TPA: hypothetical protein VKD90_11650 [Gemmataceae bacterium]|nr:hypothetical protein [Gemmataceae bacterium]
MKTLIRLAAVLGALAAAGTDARAQTTPPQLSGRPLGGVATPTFSPYLNLARGGNPAINYYGLVRPQINFATSLDVLQGQLLAGQQADARAPGEIAPTGHPIAFLNTGSYFLSTGGGRAGTLTSTPLQGRPGTLTRPAMGARR